MARRRLPREPQQIASRIRRRIAEGGERLWRYEDFSGAPVSAVAKALSRLAAQGQLQRLSKGVYYRPRPTTFGNSLPKPADVRKLAAQRRTIFPAGIVAANLLGFTTQAPRRPEVATSGFRLPRKLLGDDTIIHTRRPDAWTGLRDMDAALLDFLRRGGSTSELSPEETVQRTLELFRQRGRFKRLLDVAEFEPPRVRAMMGAIGQDLDKKPATLRRLRKSLNPLSRFEFGRLRGLAHARDWQAKRWNEER